MDPERFRLLSGLFQAAIEAPPAERQAFAERAAAEDPELGRRLAAMLEAHEASIDLLALPKHEPEDAGEAEPAPPPRIGPYRVLEEIGRGGMGAVYLAVRDDGSFRRQVAIKLIKRGMDSDEIVRRFVAERQILAQLQHPNIARLLDGGSTADGRPYFVLEHIAGRPLAAYCAEQGLGVEARLRLWLAVCSAVAFAHQNLVVHRDLKPGNILVGNDGVPKLLDFGIAKLLAPSPLEPALTATYLPAGPMTPDYASPEQRAGRPVTTATDVFGLGLLLCELLTGHGPAAMARLGGGELPSPSRVVRGLGLPASPGDGGLPGDAKRLARRLAGDLDTIAGKALAQEPGERYASVAELAGDVERHLAQLPVKARRPTLRYRLGRALRRHKVAAGVAATFLLALAFGAWQAYQTARERDRAEAQARRAEALAGLLVEVFKGSEPARSRGAEVTARELLEEAERRLLATEGSTLGSAAAHAALEPRTRAYLLHVIGEVNDQLGLYPEARRVFERALDLRDLGAGREAELEAAATLTQLAHVLRQQGELAASDALYRRALEIRVRLAGPDSLAVAETVNGLGLLHLEKNEPERAEELLLRAVGLRRRGGAELDLAESLLNLAALRIEQERPEEAEALLAEGTEIHHRLLGSEHPRLAIDLSSLAALLFRQGRFDDAARRYREALALRRRLLPAGHPDVAVNLSNLAAAEDKRGDLAAAEQALSEALAIHRGRPAGPHPDLADTLSGLAAVLQKKGDPRAALPLFEQAIAMYRALSGEQSPEVATALSNLALLERDLGDQAAAERLARQALRMRRELLGPEHPTVAASLNLLGGLLRQAGRLAEAEDAYRQAVALRRKALGPGHPDLATSLLGLGSVLLERRRAREAQEPLENALRLRRQAFPSGHFEIARAESGLGACYAALGRQAEARELLERSLRTLETKRGVDHPDTRLARERLRAIGGPTTRDPASP